MAIFYKPAQINLCALEESLNAAELLLPTYDLDDSAPLFLGQRRMGFPAAILLFSYVESIGHLTEKRKANEDSFLVLREHWFGNQFISIGQCRSMYKFFRNTLCHNSMLPAEFFIDCNSKSDQLVCTAAGIKKDVVKSVNLYSLLQLSKKALVKVKAANHETFFDSSQALTDVLKKSLFVPVGSIYLESPSGLPTINYSK